MKKLPLILSIILLFAVGFLFVREFFEKDDDNTPIENTQIERSANGRIAYVEVDTIIINFDLYFDLRDELMSKQQASEAELNAKGREYEVGAKDYEDKVRKGLVTRATAAQMEQDLMAQQQSLLNLRDQLQYNLAEEENVMNRRILEYIYDFLEEYSAENEFDFILGKSFGSPVMYSNSSLNITQEVLMGVNEKYQAEKK